MRCTRQGKCFHAFCGHAPPNGLPPSLISIDPRPTPPPRRNPCPAPGRWLPSVRRPSSHPDQQGARRCCLHGGEGRGTHPRSIISQVPTASDQFCCALIIIGIQAYIHIPTTLLAPLQPSWAACCLIYLVGFEGLFIASRTSRSSETQASLTVALRSGSFFCLSLSLSLAISAAVPRTHERTRFLRHFFICFHAPRCTSIRGETLRRAGSSIFCVATRDPPTEAHHCAAPDPTWTAAPHAPPSMKSRDAAVP